MSSSQCIVIPELRLGDVEGNALKPGFVDGDLPPPSPGLVSTNSAWSELLNIGTSRKSSDAGLSEYSR